MPTPDHLSERRQAVATLTRQGWTGPCIAQLLSVCKRTVERDRAAMGLARPAGRPWTDAENLRAKQLLADGASLCEVARTLGREHSIVCRHFRGQGWTYTDAARFGVELRRLTH